MRKHLLGIIGIVWLVWLYHALIGGRGGVGQHVYMYYDRHISNIATWADCDRTPPTSKEDRTRQLFEQLVSTRDALDSCGFPFWVWQGTLIGAWRDHGPNVAETDNDIFVPRRPPPECIEALKLHKLLFVDSGRICRDGNFPDYIWNAHSPLREYFIYTDVYWNELHHELRIKNTDFMDMFWRLNTIQVPFGVNETMPSPKRDLAMQCLNHLYKNWNVRPNI